MIKKLRKCLRNFLEKNEADTLEKIDKNIKGMGLKNLNKKIKKDTVDTLIDAEVNRLLSKFDSVCRPVNSKITVFGRESINRKENTFEKDLTVVLDNLKNFLLEKNKNYGNSALEPINIFSKLNSENSINQRLDDKLTRIKNSKELRKNDCVDLVGYLMLLLISKEWKNFDEFID